MIIVRIIILAFAIFASGCAIQHPMKLNENYLNETPAFSPSQRLQGAGLIVMTSEEQPRVHSSRAAYFLGSGSEFSFEVGKITEVVAEQVFRQVFTKGVKVDVAPPTDPTITAVHPMVKNLEWWFRPPQYGSSRFQEVVKFDLAVVIERSGQRVFDKTYSSGEVGGRSDTGPAALGLGTEANRALHQAIRRLMEQAASEFMAQR